MLDLQLTVEPLGSDAVSAAYQCPCGCTPATTYRRGEQAATEGCCCGNEFAVGPNAGANVHVKFGYELMATSLAAPWGEDVPVAWAIGPSTHEAPDEHAADHPAVDHESGHHAADGAHVGSGPATLLDSVCGMVVDREAARGRGLVTDHRGTDFFFCGKGCKLEFEEAPERFLDPTYVPSM